MKRVWKISDVVSQPELVCFHRISVKPAKTVSPLSFFLIRPTNFRNKTSELNNQTDCSEPSIFSKIIHLFSDKPSSYDLKAKKILVTNVESLRDELLQHAEDSDGFLRILDEFGGPLFRRYPDGSAAVELLNQLGSSPHLVLEVLNWRRKQEETINNPMSSLEYAKGITIAGRIGYVDLAVELFTEAMNKKLQTTSTYNALMGAFMFNGLADKCRSLFCDLKRDSNCIPTIVTYNILISVFGSLMLVDQMEATFKEIKDLNLSPSISTYNNLIAGYITAWMWDDMEKNFQEMLSSPVQPDINTYLLMLRGYAHSGNLEKMEETYELVKHLMDEKDIPLIRSMIRAYCNSSAINRIKKIEALLKCLPEEEYRPWLNVLLIRLYAQEDWLDKMENAIDEAFEQKTSVMTAGVMRSIIASYFRCNAVYKLANFVRRAELGGWKICRSLYHCKMVMYASEKRLEEMESVLKEMKHFHLDPSKKTFWILYKAYANTDQKKKVRQVVGLMFKHGYGFP